MKSVFVLLVHSCFLTDCLLLSSLK